MVEEDHRPIAIATATASAEPSAPPLALCVPTTAATVVAPSAPAYVEAVAVPLVPARLPRPRYTFDPYARPPSSAPRHRRTLAADGARGADAAHGANGADTTYDYDGSRGGRGVSASPALPGEPGGRLDLALRYTGEVSFVRERPCRMHVVVSSASGVRRSGEEVLELGDLPDISISSVGGDGGHGGNGGHGGAGARGCKGRDASRYSNAGDGGRGGNGGDGGQGSSGGGGGRGGVILIIIPENDRFLLMAIECTDQPAPLVQGGRGGQKGRHGRGGKGGMGGKGGKSYSYTDSDGNWKSRSGGLEGRPGCDGWVTTLPLHDGAHGDGGMFAIQLTNGSTTTAYPNRYNLQLVGHTLAASHEMVAPNNFQFGDTVFVRRIEVFNSGGMPSPSDKVVFSISAATDYIVPLNERKAMLPHGSAAVPVNQTRVADGCLEYFVALPRASTDSDDYGPIVRWTNLRLRATQLGPEESGSDSCFQRDYRSFNVTGTPLCFRYPIANHDGFQGISSVRAGETMKVRLTLTNISLHDIGSRSTSSRKVWVQFYSSAADIDLHLNGEECEHLGRVELGSNWRGHRIDVPLVGYDSFVELKGTLLLSDQILPYTTVEVHADILLENLPSPFDVGGSNREQAISLIQRRKLEVVSEPTCAFRQDCQVILVTSESFSRYHFTLYNEIIVNKLGFRMDTYSVSLYGSLSPDFIIAPGRTLHQYFSGKLIIVIDREFNPLDDSVHEMHPSAMLPNGCQEQASGFHPSTKWLFVESSKLLIEGLLITHYTSPANDITTFSSVSEFKKAMKKRVDDEYSEGEQDKTIREDVIHFTSRGRKERIAQSVASFCEKHDPLRQHVVELIAHTEEKGRLIVRRGFCSTMNSAFVVQEPWLYSGEELHTLSTATLHFAIAQALPPQLGMEAFCHCVDGAKDGELCKAFRNAFASKFLRETENFLVGGFAGASCSSDVMMQNFFPSISYMANNQRIAALIRERGHDAYVRAELSSLVGKLRCVANSKDLRPRFLPFSSKYHVKHNLMEAVDAIEESWKPALDHEMIESQMKEIKESVRARIKNTRHKRRVRAHNRWRKGLRWKFTLREEDGGRMGVTPLIEMGQFFKQGNNASKYTHRMPLTRVPEPANCEAFRQRAQQRLDMSRKLQESIEATRLREVLDDAEPEISLTS